MCLLMIRVLKKGLKLIFNRYTIGVALLGGAIYMMVEGDNTMPEEKLRKMLQEGNIMSESEIGALNMRYKNVDLNAGVRFYQSRYGKDALHHMAYDLKGSKGRAVLELCKYVRENSGRMSTDQEQYVDMMSLAAFGGMPTSPELQNGMQLILSNYAEILAKAQEAGGVTAEMVAENPISAWVYAALCLNSDTASPQAWKAYCNNRDWMPDAVTLLYITYSDTETPAHVAMLRLIHDCAKYNSMRELLHAYVSKWRDEVEKNAPAEADDELTPAEETAFCVSTIAQAYKKYGDVIDSICANRVPPEDALNLLLLNLHSLEEDTQKNREKHFIEDVYTLWNIAENHSQMKPGILDTPNVLLLLRAAGPNKFTEALAKYDIAQLCPLLLFICTDEEKAEVDQKAMSNALEALCKYGDMAINTFQAQADQPEFRVVLSKDYRSVGYLCVHKQDKDALSNLQKNNWKGYIDKEIEPDGTPKGEGWVEYIPVVGSLAQCGINAVQGYPCTWSELGWAAYEGAEIVIVVTATVATAPGGGVGGAGAAVGMSALKTAIKGGGKIVAKSYAKKTISTAAKTTALKAARRGALRRMVLNAGKGLRKISHTTKVLGEKSAANIGKIIKNPKLMRYSAATMAGFEFCARTWPNLDKVAYGPGRIIGKATVDIPRVFTQGLKDGLTSSVREAMGQSDHQLSRGFTIVLSLLLALLALLILFGSKIYSFITTPRKKTLHYT